MGDSLTADDNCELPARKGGDFVENEGKGLCVHLKCWREMKFVRCTRCDVFHLSMLRDWSLSMTGGGGGGWRSELKRSIGIIWMRVDDESM